MSIRSINNSIIGSYEPYQHAHTNKYMRGLIEASNNLRENLEATGKKRFIIPLAMPVGIARGVMTGVMLPALIIDRVANAIRDARDGRLSNSKKFRKCITLPFKVLIIACAVPAGLALIPIFTIAHTISSLVFYRLPHRVFILKINGKDLLTLNLRTSRC